MSLFLRPLYEGQAAKVFALVEREEPERTPSSSSHVNPRLPSRVQCPVADFLADQKRRDPDERARLLQLIEFTASHGPPRNIEKCRELGGTDGLFELKTRGGLRLFWFWDAHRMIVCTHGTVKKSQKTPPGEIARAQEWRNRYLLAKKQHGAVPHEKEAR